MRCKYCGIETYPGQRTCYPCLDIWTNMRKQIFEYNKIKYGALSSETLEQFKKETKRLEKIWHKDKELFNKEIAGKN